MKNQSLFPVLHQEVHGSLWYIFDNAATTQKPQSVFGCSDGILQSFDNSNKFTEVHHALAASGKLGILKKTRETIKDFIHAGGKAAWDHFHPKKLRKHQSWWGAFNFGRKIHEKGRRDRHFITMEAPFEIVPLGKLLCEKKEQYSKNSFLSVNSGEILTRSLKNYFFRKPNLVSISLCIQIHWGTLIRSVKISQAAQLRRAKSFVRRCSKH